MNSEVEQQVLLNPVSRGPSAQNLVEMGKDLQAAGILDVRGLVGELQELGMQAAMAAVPVVMEKVRKVNEARIRQMIYEVKLLPPAPVRLLSTLLNSNPNLVYVSRDAVLAVIQNVAVAPPRMS